MFRTPRAARSTRCSSRRRHARHPGLPAQAGRLSGGLPAGRAHAATSRGAGATPGARAGGRRLPAPCASRWPGELGRVDRLRRRPAL
ncbi:MAG: hypothetical protein MZW92_01270 [Comamonadaceae bacterium]|nr:hypothetical protein [Comamonadaceae bacterium]